MPSLPTPSAQDIYSRMRDLHWSPKEKTIARRAFDRALHRELEAAIQEGSRWQRGSRSQTSCGNLNAI